MFVVDTNILIYALDTSYEEHSACRKLLEGWRQTPGPWYTTWGILYELLRVATHPRVFRRPLTIQQAWRFVDILLTSPGLRVLVESPNHAEAVTRTVQEIGGLRGNVLHDAHTAILMREHGLRRIYTRDTDFHRFRFLEVVDPLAS
jgi:toxin-antitoxin system PIN domain toxin